MSDKMYYVGMGVPWDCHLPTEHEARDLLSKDLEIFYTVSPEFSVT